MLTFSRGMTTAALVCALAACASPPPAPVVNRTQPPPPAARPAPGAPPKAVAPRPGTPPVASAPAVESAPVRSSGVQVRPLTTPEPAPAMPPAMVRTEPRGGKLPYSDLAVAELRQSEASRPPASAAAPAAPAAAPASPSTPAPVASVSPRPEPRAAVPTAEFDWPARGKVIQGFAEPRSMGIWIDGKPGDPVTAAADGKVIFSGVGPRGYGNLLIVKHDADTLSVYAHNRALLVKEGQSVRRGQRIAELGDSGTDRPKLHFEIRKDGKPVDPQKLLPPR